jgi:hypothetical protein
MTCAKRSLSMIGVLRASSAPLGTRICVAVLQFVAFVLYFEWAVTAHALACSKTIQYLHISNRV